MKDLFKGIGVLVAIGGMGFPIWIAMKVSGDGTLEFFVSGIIFYALWWWIWGKTLFDD